MRRSPILIHHRRQPLSPIFFKTIFILSRILIVYWPYFQVHLYQKGTDASIKELIHVRIDPWTGVNGKDLKKLTANSLSRNTDCILVKNASKVSPVDEADPATIIRYISNNCYKPLFLSDALEFRGLIFNPRPASRRKHQILIAHLFIVMNLSHTDLKCFIFSKRYAPRLSNSCIYAFVILTVSQKITSKKYYQREIYLSPPKPLLFFWLNVCSLWCFLPSTHSPKFPNSLYNF